MTESIHERLQQSGLLDGSVDADAVERWPAWGREHLQVCSSCQAELAAERQLRDAMATYSATSAQLRRRGPPSPDERKARLVARSAVGIDEVFQGTRPLPRPEMRFEGEPLELRRTSRGIRAWHPYAQDLLLLAVEGEGPPVLLHHQQEDSPGVGVDLPYTPEQGAKVVALASAEHLEPEFWMVWMRDAVSAGALAELAANNPSDFVHAAEATIPPPLRASLLRVQDEPLPEADPAVASLLKGAAAAGRSDNTAEAAMLYRKALELAFTKADRTGQIKAGIGIAYAFKGMGYTADGDKVLRWVFENHTLDAIWANWVCRHMAVDALYYSKFDEAEAWISESERVSGSPTEWTLVNRTSVHYAREEWRKVLDSVQELVDFDVPSLQRAHAEILSAGALARLGRSREARLALGAVQRPQSIPLEGRLHWKAVDIILDEVEGKKQDWPGLVEDVLEGLSEKDGGVLASWDHPPLLELVDLVASGDSSELAATLMRARFLDTGRARDSAVRLLGLCTSHRGVRLATPAYSPRVRGLRTSRARLGSMVGRARDELRARNDLEACRQLGHLLFEANDLRPGLVWVGSDGLLSDAPMAAIAASLAEGSEDLPYFRDLVGLRHLPPAREPDANAVVSLADAQRNLPWASKEVRRSEAALWLRGKHVTRDALTLEAPCGLLHLGLHAHREQGIPELQFADGPMGPIEIGQISLPGAPVVLLAGCFTAVAGSDRGVERSLADAFLRAGASAVIATRWPVLDREMHPFVRALVEAWPFENVARQVTTVCSELRRQGYPARCWAAPVVY